MDMVLRKGYYGTSHDRSPCDRFRSGSGWKRQLPLGPISCYHEPMAKATGDNTKRKRPAQTGQLIGVRLQPDQLARSEERRVGKEGVRRVRSRGWPVHEKKKKKI